MNTNQELKNIVTRLIELFIETTTRMEEQRNPQYIQDSLVNNGERQLELFRQVMESVFNTEIHNKGINTYTPNKELKEFYISRYEIVFPNIKELMRNTDATQRGSMAEITYEVLRKTVVAKMIKNVGESYGIDF